MAVKTEDGKRWREDETGKGPSGENGVGAKMSSGLGGLGLDGINGWDDSDGEGASDPNGDGNRGLLLFISGDIAGDSADGGSE